MTTLTWILLATLLGGALSILAAAVVALNARITHVPMLVSYLSRFMSLQPGDVISTGTPPGVGLGIKPEPVYLRTGQTMRLGIDGLGEQQQRTVEAP